jgi:hypothetical protein
MSFTTEQKSQLAKLMATENLTVQHKKMQTALFDPQNRVLYLPIWQNMSGDLYDLLCGHEVGHALYTPPQGWHDAATDESKGKGYKGFLNVVEDARIEKKIKRRYPGLRLSFQKGYQELMKQDFFGLEGRNVNSMPLIDRLNLFTKSQYSAEWINFNEVEMEFVRKIELIETWDDVVRLTDELYEYSKSEQQQLESNDLDTQDVDKDNLTEDYSADYSDDDDFSADAKGDESDSDENGEVTNKSDDESDSEEFDDEQNSVLDRHKESSVSNEDQYEPNCETDDNYRQNESTLVDAKSKNYNYANIPTPILKNIVTPAKVVHDYVSKFYAQYDTPQYQDSAIFKNEDVIRWMNEFKQKNEKYVGLLAKEFEMRKAAKSFSKSKISDTGDIDVNKLALHSFDDNIFRKVMLTPKGKNHGLILLLDKSGSMSDNMSGSIEQILILAMFCRKVNIPFAVYGFGNSTYVRAIDIGSTEYNKCEKTFSENDNDIRFGEVFLREYLNSQMSNAEFSRAFRNMILIQKSFDPGYRKRIVPCPETEALSNTPLTEALVVTAEIMKEFKRKNNLDITSLVIVHDGDADNIHSKYSYVKDRDLQIKLKTQYMDVYSENVVVQDRKSKYQGVLTKEYNSLNKLILGWFKATTGSKVFAFYLVPNARSVKSAIRNHCILENGDDIQEIIHRDGWEKAKQTISELNRKFNSEKFLDCNSKGYDSFYLVSGGSELITEMDEIKVESNVTSSKLKNAFMKFNKNKAVNRVLVSRFISGIAA